MTMQRLGLLLTCCGIVGMAAASVQANCEEPCKCTKCFELLTWNDTVIKYRVLNISDCCRKFRHPEQDNLQDGYLAFTADLIHVQSANPNCLNWWASKHRTAESCYIDIPDSEVEMTCYYYCQGSD
jgi:hypothetical protein